MDTYCVSPNLITSCHSKADNIRELRTPLSHNEMLFLGSYTSEGKLSGTTLAHRPNGQWLVLQLKLHFHLDYEVISPLFFQTVEITRYGKSSGNNRALLNKHTFSVFSNQPMRS